MIAFLPTKLLTACYRGKSVHESNCNIAAKNKVSHLIRASSMQMILSPARKPAEADSLSNTVAAIKIASQHGQMLIVFSSQEA